MDLPQAPAGAGDTLPPLYARWMSELLPGRVPDEPNATCSDCAMWSKSDVAAEPGDQFYSRDTKCCTFLPALSNFLVGRILTDRDTDATAVRGRATVEARIERGVGVSPLGLERTATFAALYRLSPNAFGKASALRCPHYLPEDGGRCGVWRHRESTCATWFCKFERGEIGRTFWHRLHDLLAGAEMAVTRHCVLSLGIDPESLRRLFPSRVRRSLSATNDGITAADVDGTVDGGAYAILWGSWLGKEREFYERSAALVESLAWRDILTLGGSELRVLADLAVDAYHSATSTGLPPRLERRQLKVVYTSATQARIVGYSNLDPLKAPKKLIEALHCFDGSPTAVAVQRISDEHGLKLTDSLVRKLVDFGVLEATK